MDILADINLEDHSFAVVASIEDTETAKKDAISFFLVWWQSWKRLGIEGSTEMAEQDMKWRGTTQGMAIISFI